MQETRQTWYLPSVDQVLKSRSITPIVDDWGLKSTTLAVRTLQAQQRKITNIEQWARNADTYAESVACWLRTNRTMSFKKVFNLSGILLHTNLGRAVVSDEVAMAAIDVATRPSSIEFDVETGKRGDREKSIRQRLELITDCESALVVNNNAAAVLLILNTLALDKPVLVSRGELVEIGGSFRLPDIITRSGCQLLEVGTTNRTRLHDYKDNLQKAAMILKVYPSNYRITGFTESVSVRELSTLCQDHLIPCAVDLGSGALIDTTRLGLPRESKPSEILHHGADLVCFSGDKLLGGPQAGIILGKNKYIEALNSNPLKRALRVDKLSLAMLDATLKLYENEENAIANIQTLKQLSTSIGQLRERAESVASVLKQLIPEYEVEISSSNAQIGSGTLTDAKLKTVVLCIRHARSEHVRKLTKRMRQLRIPVIGRVQKDALVLDMLCAEPVEELIENLGGLA